MAEPDLISLGGGTPETAPVAPSSEGDPAVWALLGETGSDPKGQVAVGSTMLNRATKYGKSIQDIVTDPAQGYEAWNDPKARARVQAQYPVGSAPYQAAQQTLADLQSGKTQPLPYTHFFAPDAQAKLGRPAPDWSRGQAGTDIAGNRFYALPDQLAGSSEPDLVALGGGTSSAPSADGSGANKTPAIDPMDKVAADVAQAQIASAAASGKAQWPIYDPANNVGRNADGSIAFIGKPPPPPERDASGALHVDLTSSTNPLAIKSWLAAHPLDPANHPDVYGLPNASSEMGGNALDRAGVGAAQGVANVGNSLLGMETALRSNPLGNALLNTVSPNSPFGNIAADRAALGEGLLNRNTNESMFGTSGAYGLGKFAGEAIPSTAIIAGTEGLGSAGLGAMGLDLGTAGTAGGNLLYRAPGMLASSVAKGAAYGGGGAALTSAGSSAPAGQQIAQGAIAGGVFNPLLGAGGAAIGAPLNLARKVAAPYIEPLFNSGRNSIADRMLLEAAQGGNMSNPDLTEYIPGNRPTTAQAYANPGLAADERTMAAINPAPFSAKATADAARRDAVVSDLKGDEARRDALVAERTAVAEPIRQVAFANKAPVDPQPILDHIDSVLTGPDGQRDAIAAPLEDLRAKIVKATAPDGTVDPEQLYGVRKDLNDKIHLPATANGSLKAVAGEMTDVRDVIDPVIDSGAPGFKDFVKTYAAMSKPIDEHDFLAGLNLATPKGAITQGQLGTALRTIGNLQRGAGINKAKSLSPETMETLQNLYDDTARANVSTDLGRGAGSDTFQKAIRAARIGNNPLFDLATDAAGMVHPSAGWLMRGVGALGSHLGGQSAQAKIIDLYMQRLLSPDLAKAAFDKASVAPSVAPAGVFNGPRNLLLTGSGIVAGQQPTAP